MSIVSTKSNLTKDEVKKEIEKLVDIIRQPRKYMWVVNAPGRFDSAEYLLKYWDILNNKQKDAVEKVLVNSGKYK